MDDFADHDWFEETDDLGVGGKQYGGDVFQLPPQQSPPLHGPAIIDGSGGFLALNVPVDDENVFFATTTSAEGVTANVINRGEGQFILEESNAVVIQPPHCQLDAMEETTIDGATSKCVYMDCAPSTSLAMMKPPYNDALQQQQRQPNNWGHSDQFGQHPQTSTGGGGGGAFLRYNDGSSSSVSNNRSASVAPIQHDQRFMPAQNVFLNTAVINVNNAPSSNQQHFVLGPSPSALRPPTSTEQIIPYQQNYQPILVGGAVPSHPSSSTSSLPTAQNRKNGNETAAAKPVVGRKTAKSKKKPPQNMAGVGTATQSTTSTGTIDGSTTSSELDQIAKHLFSKQNTAATLQFNNPHTAGQFGMLMSYCQQLKQQEEAGINVTMELKNVEAKIADLILQNTSSTPISSSKESHLPAPKSSQSAQRNRSSRKKKQPPPPPPPSSSATIQPSYTSNLLQQQNFVSASELQQQQSMMVPHQSNGRQSQPKHLQQQEQQQQVFVSQTEGSSVIFVGEQQHQPHHQHQFHQQQMMLVQQQRHGALVAHNQQRDQEMPSVFVPPSPDTPISAPFSQQQGINSHFHQSTSNVARSTPPIKGKTAGTVQQQRQQQKKQLSTPRNPHHFIVHQQSRTQIHEEISDQQREQVVSVLVPTQIGQMGLLPPAQQNKQQNQPQQMIYSKRAVRVVTRENPEEIIKRKEAEEAKKRERRKIRLADHFEKMLEQIGTQDYGTAFAHRMDCLQRLLPFALYDEPEFSETHLGEYDAELERFNGWLKKRKAGVEDRLRGILYRDAMCEMAEEKNLLLHLDGEYERRELERELTELNVAGPSQKKEGIKKTVETTTALDWDYNDWDPDKFIRAPGMLSPVLFSPSPPLRMPKKDDDEKEEDRDGDDELEEEKQEWKEDDNKAAIRIGLRMPVERATTDAESSKDTSTSAAALFVKKEARLAPTVTTKFAAVRVQIHPYPLASSSIVSIAEKDIGKCINSRNVAILEEKQQLIKEEKERKLQKVCHQKSRIQKEEKIEPKIQKEGKIEEKKLEKGQQGSEKDELLNELKQQEQKEIAEVTLLQSAADFLEKHEGGGQRMEDAAESKKQQQQFDLMDIVRNLTTEMAVAAKIKEERRHTEVLQLQQMISPDGDGIILPQKSNRIIVDPEKMTAATTSAAADGMDTQNHYRSNEKTPVLVKVKEEREEEKRRDEGNVNNVTSMKIRIKLSKHQKLKECDWKVGGEKTEEEERIEKEEEKKKKTMSEAAKEQRKAEKKRLKAEKKALRKREKEERRKGDIEEQKPSCSSNAMMAEQSFSSPPPPPSLKISLKKMPCWKSVLGGSGTKEGQTTGARQQQLPEEMIPQQQQTPLKIKLRMPKPTANNNSSAVEGQIWHKNNSSSHNMNNMGEDFSQQNGLKEIAGESKKKRGRKRKSDIAAENSVVVTDVKLNNSDNCDISNGNELTATPKKVPKIKIRFGASQKDPSVASFEGRQGEVSATPSETLLDKSHESTNAQRERLPPMRIQKSLTENRATIIDTSADISCTPPPLITATPTTPSPPIVHQKPMPTTDDALAKPVQFSPCCSDEESDDERRRMRTSALLSRIGL